MATVGATDLRIANGGVGPNVSLGAGMTGRVVSGGSGGGVVESAANPAPPK